MTAPDAAEARTTFPRRWRAAILPMVLCTAGIHAQPALAGNELNLIQQGPSLGKPALAVEKPSDVSAKRLWQISLATLAAANALDVHSSLGKHELNSTLAGSAGTLGTQGILIKGALQGGLMGIEYLVTRSRSHGSLTERTPSKLYRTLATINFVSTGVLTGVAIHNYTVPRAR